MLLCWLALSLALVLLLATGASAAMAVAEGPPVATPVSLEQYEETMRAVLREVEDSRVEGPANRSRRLTEALRLVRSVEAVALPSGEQIVVDNGWLIAELSRTPPDFDTATSRLRGLVDALHAARTSPARSWPTDPEAALRAVLAQKSYRWDKGAAPDDPFARAFAAVRTWVADQWHRLQQAAGRLLQPLRDWLDDLLSGLAPEGTSFDGLPWPVYALGILVILGFATLLVWSLRRQSSPRAALRRAATIAEEATTMAQAFDGANRLAKQGEYRAAIRSLYLAALLFLQEKQLIRYDRTMTNREHLRTLRANQPLHDLLVPLVLTFDQIWYGQRTPTAADYEAYREEVEGLRRTVG